MLVICIGDDVTVSRVQSSIVCSKRAGLWEGSGSGTIKTTTPLPAAFVNIKSCSEPLDQLGVLRRIY